ncbi:Titin [Stylophora pistillata]|uniref:Titin n=2 Tax=Stylophora pistillata TaxID=50429 RepID=A0A2B4RQ54_STYPI|nr:Titin [Stylophora pistillata]
MQDQSYSLRVVSHSSRGSDFLLYSNEVEFSLPISEEILAGALQKTTAESYSGEGDKNQDGEAARELLLVAERVTSESCESEQSAEGEELSLKSVISKLQTIPEDQQLDVLAAEPDTDVEQGVSSEEMDDLKTMLVDNELLHRLEKQENAAGDGLVPSGYEEADVKDASADLSSPLGEVETCTAVNVELDPAIFRGLDVSHRGTDSIVRSLVDSTEDERKASQLYEEVMDEATTGRESNVESYTPTGIVYNELQEDVIVNQCVVRDHGPTVEQASEQDVGTQKTLENGEGKRTQLMDSDEQSSSHETSADLWDHNEKQGDEDATKNENFIAKRDKLNSHAKSHVASQGSTNHDRAGDNGVQVSWDNDKPEVESRKEPDQETVEDGSHFNDLGHDTFIAHSRRSEVGKTDLFTSDGMSSEMADDCTEKVVCGLPKHDASGERELQDSDTAIEDGNVRGARGECVRKVILPDHRAQLTLERNKSEQPVKNRELKDEHHQGERDDIKSTRIQLQNACHEEVNGKRKNENLQEELIAAAVEVLQDSLNNFTQVKHRAISVSEEKDDSKGAINERLKEGTNSEKVMCIENQSADLTRQEMNYQIHGPKNARDGNRHEVVDDTWSAFSSNGSVKIDNDRIMTVALETTEMPTFEEASVVGDPMFELNSNQEDVDFQVERENRDSNVKEEEAEDRFQGGSKHLPRPLLVIKGTTPTTVTLEWEWNLLPGQIVGADIVYSVFALGRKFHSDINSNFCFNFEDSPMKTMWPNENAHFKQHAWRTTGCVIEITGLKQRCSYRMAVLGQLMPCADESLSRVISFTMPGPPKSPLLHVRDLQDRQVTLTWKPPASFGDATVVGYRLLKDGKAFREDLSSETLSLSLTGLEEGVIHNFSLLALTGHSVGDSKPSNAVVVHCPIAPASPEIYIIESSTWGSICIAWKRDKLVSSSYSKRPVQSSYCVFVDGVLHGECALDHVTDIFSDEHTYTITDCIFDRKYSLSVRKYLNPDAGTSEDKNKVCVCGCYGESSNILEVYCPGPPSSPVPRVSHIDQSGVTLSWSRSREYGGVALEGYLLCINGKWSGELFPPEQQETKLTGFRPGDVIRVQMAAVASDLGVPISETVSQEINKARSFPSSFELLDSGVESSSSLLSKGSVDHSEQLSRSLGPPLLIQYSNLVRPISRFGLTNVCCRSVCITWSLDVTASCSVEPAILRAFCWKTTKHRRSAVRYRVEEKPFRIKDLEPGMEYYVMLECLASHVNDDSSNEQPINRNQSQPISFKTGIPPGPLTNIYVISATEQSIKLAWEAPVEHGVPAAMILVNVKKTSQHSTEQGVNFHVSPDSTAFEFEHLASRTLYAFTFKVLTEDDIFDISEERSTSIASFCASTNGVDAADKLTLTSRTPTSLSIKWQPAEAHGFSIIQHYKVHYDLNRRQRKRSRGKVVQQAETVKDFVIASERCEAALRGLEPGCVYKIVVQTVEGLMDHSYEENYDSDDSDTNPANSSTPSEKPADVQRIHLSGPLLVSTLAPPESPVLMVSDFTATQIRLTWNRPLVLSPVTNDDDIPCGRVRHLKGFRVQINGRVFSRLTADKTSITIKKCKSGMKYTCVVVAVTCPEMFGGHQRKQSEPPDTAISDTDTDEDDIKSSSDCFEESASDPVEVTLPRQDWGVCLRADYCASRPASSLGSSPCSETGDEDGGVIVQWKLLSDLAVYTSGFRVVWYCSTLDDRMEVSLSGDANEYGIWAVSPSAVYTIYLEVLDETKEAKAVFGPVHCQTPGPPASPWIWCRTLSLSQITIEWNEPVTYGNVSIRGYQVYLNDRRLEKLVDRTQRRVTFHCQSSCVYRVSLVALGSDPQYGDSPPSNVLKLFTPAAQVNLMGRRPSVGVKRPSPDFTVNVPSTSNTSFSFEWTHPPEILDTADHYVIKWSSVVQPQVQELTLPLMRTCHMIKDCSPGTNHFLVVAAVNAAGGLVSRSEQYLVQTSAPVQQPVLKLRLCCQTSITIEWSKPTTFGDAEIDHYELMVNRKSEAQLDVEFSEYKFNTFESCHEYTFVLKAVSTKPTCDSRWSEPLVVTCPGSEKPQIARIQSHQVNCISLGWKPPLLKGGAEVASYKVYYLEDNGELVTSGSFTTNEKTIKHGPLPSQTEKDELFPVSPDRYYWVMLQLELLPDDCLAVCSEPIRTRAAVSPDSPLISLEVECLDERRRLEERICELTYKRDRLQKIVSSLKNSIVVKGSREKENKIVEVTNSSLEVHSELSDALEDIKEYTGSISTLIRWSRPHDDGDAVVSGYQVFVDGARYGKILSQRSLETRLKLSTDCHVIAVQTLTDHPVGPSSLSNPVEVSGCEFLPFVLFCYFDVHKRGESCPRHGCCSWEDSHSFEFKHRSQSSGEVFSPQGILARRIPCPVLSVMDVFSALWRPVAPVGLNKMVALLFWTKWCFSSQKVMEYFVQFAEEFADEFSFVTCCVRSEEPLTSHRQALADILTERGWRKSTDCVTHTCGCHSQRQRTRHARRGVMSNPDICQLFGLVGTPTLILLNSSSYISWHGRCSCQDASSFRLFLLHIFSQVSQTLCPVSSCRHCELDKEDEQGTSSRDDEENPENISSKQRRESSELKFLHQRLHQTKSDDAFTGKPSTSQGYKKERTRQKPTTAVGRSARSSGYNRLSGFVETYKSYPRSFSAGRFIHSNQNDPGSFTLKSRFGTPQISNQSSPGRFALPVLSRQRTKRTHPHERGLTPKVKTKISVDDFDLG